MARHKKIAGEDGGAPDGADEPQQRPEGIPDDVWELSGLIGNLALARSMVDVSTGARPPKDAAEISALVKASNGVQQKAINRYLKLRDGIGAKLRASYDQYTAAKERTDNLTRLFSDPKVLVNGRQNGDAGTGESARQSE